jgi:hypothetical protein
MFIIVYHKTTKKLAYFHHDMSAPQVNTAQYWYNIFLKDNELGDENYSFAEVLVTKALNDIVIGNHVFNETTGQVEADPSYVPPPKPTPPAPETTEPTE